MSQEDDPRTRLLRAAISFVAQGHTPTTRELVARAGTNIASINYYFQGKDNLIAQALDEAAVSDIETWLTDNLPPSLSPRARLRTLCQYLGRIHRNFHTFSHAQLLNITLPGRPERATARAMAALLDLLEQADAPHPRHTAVSLMASLHYLSIFHAQLPEMSGLPLDTPDDLIDYVDTLLSTHDLL